MNETSTRTIIIDPILEALGWNVRDPDLVELEYPTIDGKFVDYALKLNGKPVLLVEAKAVDGQIDDVKSITQVVGYAANNGIVWCILTNGIKWRVYKSIENCAAPDKLMYEVSLDPRENESEGLTVDQIANKLNRISADEMARGTLDEVGERIFTDGKVRKALHSLMKDPPRKFVTLIRENTSDSNLTLNQIRESLSRIADDNIGVEGLIFGSGTVQKITNTETGNSTDSSPAARKTGRAGKGKSPYDESHHISGKPRESIQLYKSIERICAQLSSTGISKRYLSKNIKFECNNKCFCSVKIYKSGLRVRLNLKYGNIENPPNFARDVSDISHWGDFELRISNDKELKIAEEYIRQSFESVCK